MAAVAAPKHSSSNHINLGSIISERASLFVLNLWIPIFLAPIPHMSVWEIGGKEAASPGVRHVLETKKMRFDCERSRPALHTESATHTHTHSHAEAHPWTLFFFVGSLDARGSVLWR